MTSLRPLIAVGVDDRFLSNSTLICEVDTSKDGVLWFTVVNGGWSGFVDLKSHALYTEMDKTTPVWEGATIYPGPWPPEMAVYGDYNQLLQWLETHSHKTPIRRFWWRATHLFSERIYRLQRAIRCAIEGFSVGYYSIQLHPRVVEHSDYPYGDDIPF